jgi:hypothetical protein
MLPSGNDRQKMAQWGTGEPVNEWDLAEAGCLLYWQLTG